MNVNFMGTARRFVRQALGSSQIQARLSALESLSVNQVEPPKYELSRSGRRYVGGNQVIASGIAPVTAIPTTTATLALYNADADGGVALVIERLGFWLGSGTPTAGATLLACVSNGPLATPVSANASNYSSSSASASSLATNAFWGTAITIPGGSWFQALSTFQAAAANVGQGDGLAMFEGALVIPPRHALGLAILSGTGTTPLYGISAMWSEIETDLE